MELSSTKILETGSNEWEEMVLEKIKWCQERKKPPLVWAVEIVKCLQSSNSVVELPSPELGHLLVSHLCFNNNHPSLWKFIYQAFSSRLLSPLQLLSLLTSRVIPNRHSHPEAYRLYLELLRRYAIVFDPVRSDSCKRKIIESVDFALCLSQNYGVHVVELGHAFVLFFFSIFLDLLDSTLDDWGLQLKSLETQNEASGNMDPLKMDLDLKETYNSGRNDQRENLRRKNSRMAIEVLGDLSRSRKAKFLLRLVYLNMPEKFDGLLQKLQFLEAINMTLPDKSVNNLVARLSANIQRVLDFEYQLNKRQFIGMLIDTGSSRRVTYCGPGSGQFSCWVPFDIYMEKAMDGRHLPIRSAVAILTETINSLRVVNRASWQETFLELWISALRLVQRERDPLEGPIPHLETRLCVLLSIVPLAIACILEDEIKLSSCSLQGATPSCFVETGCESRMVEKICASKKLGLISSLQLLGNFSGLLCPPASVTNAANRAAKRAASFVSSSAIEGLPGGIPVGNMRHLIVEACITRNLIDTSAYFWPSYLSASIIPVPDLSTVQKSPWSIFMEGAPLAGSLINMLFITPASSRAEVEKLYHIALSGSGEEKAAAAKILCGASLSCGWNIQEHVVHFVVKLLSPPIPPGYTTQGSHLIDYMPMLSAILFGASSIDTVHILSLHGVVPEVAAALLPLCEVFGSLTPTSSNRSNAGDEPSVYMVFSSAFLFLLRLWKFYRPPLEQCITSGAIGVDLSLEYLLLLCNSRITSHHTPVPDEIKSAMDQLEYASEKPVYIDNFPKLRAWYCQNKSCIASTLSGLSAGSPVHQVANKILNMIYWKITKIGASSGNSSTPSSSSMCGSPTSTGEDAYQRPLLAAWEVLEALPFVLEAILTACAHGWLSSRDLTTGLRDLVDFLPASLAAIISYFSAEVTRGIWKPVPMNGIDWPNPAAILSLVESEMKEILATAGVDIPTCSFGMSPVMLPLPVAALVSLTITFKLTKSLEYIHAVVGPALENCASGCPWPSIPIIGSLWAQKVRRWHNFIVVSCSRSVFRQNKEAVSQLLRSCFSSFVGSVHDATSLLTNQRRINGLLGSVLASPGICPSLAPGFLYLRSCRSIHNIRCVNDVIVGLVVEYARESAIRWASTDSPRLKSSEASLAPAIRKAREIATLGASLLAVTGSLQLVQELYQETMPTWLLSSRQEKVGQVSVVACIMEGYALAYFLILSGSLVWGVGDKPPSWAVSRRSRILGAHMDFLVRVLEGNVSLGCDPSTWKAYISCTVGLMVSCAPAWIREVKLETLQKLAVGLMGWHENELALSLLERGGVGAMGLIAELLDVIN